jgi:hypothetical protein
MTRDSSVDYRDLVAIDRVARAQRRRELRAAQDAAEAPPRTPNLASVSMEVEGLLNPGRKHQLERMEWVAVAKEDERESGARRQELDAGIVRLEPPDDEKHEPTQG